MNATSLRAKSKRSRAPATLPPNVYGLGFFFQSCHIPFSISQLTNRRSRMGKRRVRRHGSGFRLNIAEPQFFEHFLAERGGKFVQWFDGFRPIHRENDGVQLINSEFA